MQTYYTVTLASAGNADCVHDAMGIIYNIVHTVHVHGCTCVYMQMYLTSNTVHFVCQVTLLPCTRDVECSPTCHQLIIHVTMIYELLT